MGQRFLMFARRGLGGVQALAIVLCLRGLAWAQSPAEPGPSPAEPEAPTAPKDAAIAPRAMESEGPKSDGPSKAAERSSAPTGSQGAEPTADGAPATSDGFDTLADALKRARRSRCATAICFGGSDHTAYAIEPLAEVPLGKTFVMPWVTGGLSDFVNNHDVSVTLAAGVRFWLAYDLVSVAVYLSSPLYDGDATIRLSGSSYEHSPSNLRRPFPGVGVGLLGDIVWIGADFNQLRNADSDVNRDLSFGRNQVISEVWTFTIGLSPIALARNGIGNATSKTK